MNFPRMPATREFLKKSGVLVKIVRKVRPLFDPHLRSVERLHRAKTAYFFQPSHFTQPDRWPEYFGFVRHRLAQIENPNILSYGCSTGEEVFSLRGYFPSSQITGIDINPYCIAKCQKKLARAPDARITFRQANAPTDKSAQNYDAIFCMAVFRHGELDALKPPQCDHLLKFHDFDQMMVELDLMLKPGGYLILWSVFFRFADTAVAQNYDVAHTSSEGKYFNEPLYDSNDKRIVGQPYNDAIFRKRLSSV